MTGGDGFRTFSAGMETSEHAPGGAFRAHRHRDGYAAVVLEGAYREMSADGVFDFAAGDIVLHPPFHLHANIFASRRVKVLNIALPFGRAQAFGYRIAQTAEPAAFAHLAAAGDCEAAFSLLGPAAPSVAHRRPGARDALTAAAALLKSADAPPVTNVAARVGLSPAHFSRAFRARYGMTPAAFRAEYRFRRALQAVLASAPLADAAQACGYADQAHMTRDFRRRAGATPADLLRQVNSVQDSRTRR